MIQTHLRKDPARKLPSSLLCWQRQSDDQKLYQFVTAIARHYMAVEMLSKFFPDKKGLLLPVQSMQIQKQKI